MNMLVGNKLEMNRICTFKPHDLCVYISSHNVEYVPTVHLNKVYTITEKANVNHLPEAHYVVSHCIDPDHKVSNLSFSM